MSEAPSQQTLWVTAEEAGMRLDLILAARYQMRYSRSYFQTLIRDHLVLLNGEQVKKHVRPVEGDEVEVEFVLTPQIDLKPEPIPLEIIYEDEEVIAVNKPAGMVVHPAPGNWSGTFVNGLLHHCRELPRPDSLRPGIVHRLDKETSGVLVAAKTARAHMALAEAFAERRVYKEYVAICVGNPGSKTIDAPIGRHPKIRTQMAVVEEGRKAVTHIETLSCEKGISIVKVVLETGRTHQIRVHLKHKNAPVLGDSVYGSASVNKRERVKRQLLHARKLEFPHPVTGEKVALEAPLPEDMKPYL